MKLVLKNGTVVEGIAEFKFILNKYIKVGLDDTYIFARHMNTYFIDEIESIQQ